MSVIESDVIAFLLVLSLVGFAIIVTAALVLRAWERVAGPELPPAVERRPEPRLYPGCLTCEGAREASTYSLTMHQMRDHAGRVRW